MNFNIFLYRANTKKPSWRYEIRYESATEGKRRVTKQGFATKRQAKEAAEKRIIELRKTASLYTDYTTFEEVYEAYLKNAKIRGVRASTLAGYQSFRTWLGDILPLPIVSVTKLQLQTMFDSMEASLSTRRVRASYLKSIFRYGIELGVLDTNPADTIRVFDNEKKKHEIDVLSPEEILKLYDELKEIREDVALVALIQGTMGLRIGEAVGIRLRDIEGAVLHVQVQNDGEPLKTKNSYRSVPIPAFTLEAIRRYISISPTSGLSDRLFGQSTASTLRSEVTKKLKKKAGITSHRLRHSYGSNLIALGMDTATVAGLLGDTVQMVTSTYIHATEAGKEKAKKLMNTAFS